MKDKIVQFLIEKYQPDAIILHGSRARGYERELSDWDIILLYSAPTEIKSGRELFENQNIELSVHVLPTSDIYDTFAAKLHHAKVLYESSNKGTVLLTQANEFYRQGVHWSEDKFEAHKLWFQGRLDGMRNYLDSPVIFL